LAKSSRHIGFMVLALIGATCLFAPKKSLKKILILRPETSACCSRDV